MTENTQVLLKRQSDGVPVAADFELASAPIAAAGDGELQCETVYLSLDPYLRGRISGRHLSGAILPGDLMAGEAISRVIASEHPAFTAGDIVAAHSGWQSHPVVSGDAARKIDTSVGPLSTFLGILGMPGLTAYAGLLRLAEPKAGDTVLVSAASGAVGSLVGQIAKIKGCRVVGIAGAAEKCAWVTNVAGFDDVVSYKSGELRQELDRVCPDGIDVYFDNVGGDMLQAAMERLSLGARVVLCGLMAQYNTTEMPPGPNPAFIIKARATVRGMVVYDHEDLRDEMVQHVSQWLREGKIQYLEDRTPGLANAPEAFSRLMHGQNVGKAIVVVSDE
ncbi:MAG: NADP-dependent oxidoreductase [Gammaproteobacteria bacterium]|nr:NADP-dependent oxidoreductase [Gammaproteobacteria bacterium]